MVISAAVAFRHNDFLWLAASGPETAGRTAGATIGTLLVLWGIVHCVRIMRRGTTSALCVSALMVFLIGWFGSTLINLLGLPQTAFVLWSPLLMLLNVTAIVLGIVGLVQYDRARFIQGKKQAVWGIVLSSITLLTLLAAFAAGVYQKMGGIVGPSSSTRKELPEYNCVVTAPARWVSVDPKLMGSDVAVLGFRKLNPEMYMMLIPEQLGEDLSLEAFADAVKANLASLAQIKDHSEEPVTIGNLEFRRLTSSAKLHTPSLELYYEHWLLVKGGMHWQISFWGSVKSREAVVAESRKFVEAFELIDPTRKISSEGSLADVRHPEWGFETQLAGQGWHPGGANMQPNPLYRFTAKRSWEALMVLPLRFEEAPPDMEALAKGMLATMDFEYPFPKSEKASTPNTTTTAHGEELELRTEREIDGSTYTYLMRIVRGEQHAHLVVGWAEKGDMTRVTRAVNAIRLGVPSGSIPRASAAESKVLASILNYSGLSYFVRNEHDAAARWFQGAYELNKEDATFLDNWAFALQSAGKPTEALALIEPELPRFPDAIDLQVRRTYLLAELGKTEDANSHFLGLIDKGLKSESELLSWVTLLMGQQRFDLAEAATVAWNKKQPSVKTRRWEAEVISAGGDSKRALDAVDALMAENPDDDHTAKTLGEILNKSGDYARAAEVAERLLSKAPQNVEALQILGWSQMGRRWYREAKETFEKAAQARPLDEEIQDAVRHASAALGQGNNSEVKTPIEPVAVPVSLSEELQRIRPPENFGEGQPAVALLRSAGYHFEKGKPLRRTLRRKIKILTSNGVDLFSTMEFPFEPLGERIFLNRLEVSDEKGEVVAKGSIEDAFVRDTSDDIASHSKILHVQVPGLQPGYTVDIEVTIQDRSAQDSFPFTRHIFAYRLPTATEAVFVTGDTAGVRHVTPKGAPLKLLKDKHSLAWIGRERSAWEFEPLAPSIEANAPVLWLGGEKESWAEVGKKYIEQIADRLQIDPAISELADELCRGLATDRDKIAVLAREVQKTISYKAIEFGVRARRPNAASDTLRQRFGDCKDHSLLLHQLLRAAKIESHLALVSTDFRIQPELPSLDQFNHMVLHVPSLGKGWLLDPTDKYLGLTAFPASGLWESHALILDSSKPRLLAPSSAPSEGSADIESRRSISADGNDWQIDETVTATGYYASWIRGSFSHQTPADQLKRVQGILGKGGAVEVKEFRFENLDDPAQPARLTMTYRLRNAVRAGDGKASASLPALWEREYLTLNFIQDRTTPVKFRYPFRFTSEVTVNLPESASLPALAGRGKNEFGNWQMTVSKPGTSGAGWKVKSQFQARSGEWPAKSYAALYDTWESARRAWDTSVEWRVP